MPIYMKLGDIKGECTERGYEKWIVLESCQLGVSRTTGALEFGSVGISFNEKIPSTEIFIACCKGNHIPQAIIKARGSSDEPYMTYQLEDCLISSYQTSGHAGGDSPPTVVATLNFTKIDIRAHTQRADGSDASVHHWWDVKTNTGG